MEQKTKLLLAEDDENLGLLLKEYLVAKGFEADLYPDGEAAYKGFMKEHYDIAILDIMMPKKDGFTLAKDIRIINPDIPVIFLTAKNLKDDVLEGFKLGADDYITKPFSMEELLVRMKAILRRVQEDKSKRESNNLYKLGNFVFDYNRQLLSIKDKDQKLTSKESELLRLLCINANNVLDRSDALKKIWKDDSYFNARSMDVYITKLRKYLKEDPDIELMNVHGIGFKLIVKENDAG